MPGSDDYDAFLSYSHAADGQLAPALRTGLEQLAKRWTRRRSLRVFQDVSGLSATPALWTTIRAALDSSRFFLLLASPASAQSEWVGREISHFAQQKPDRILLVLTDGECVWDPEAGDFDWSKTNALPRILARTFREEPLWVDMRWARGGQQLDLGNPSFRRDVAKLAAPIHGVTSDELDAADLEQHRRARRARRLAFAGLATLTVTSVVGAGVAADQRAEARAQRGQAQEQRDVAIETSRLNDARRLAALSTGFAETDTRLALLLALHSRRVEGTPEGELALAAAATQPAANLGLLPASDDGALALATDATGQQLAWSTAQLQVMVYDTENGEVEETLTPPPGAEENLGIRELSMTPDGQGVAAVTGNGQLWLADRTESPALDVALRKNVADAAFARDEPRLAVLLDNGRLILARAGEDAIAQRVVSGAAIALGWSRDGSQLAVAAEDRVVVVDSDTLNEVVTWPLPAGTASVDGALDLEFSHDGGLVAIGGLDGAARTWRVSTGKLEKTFTGHADGVRRVAWGYQDESLVTTGFDTSVRIWDVGSGKTLGDLRAHEWAATGLIVSPDEHTLWTADTVSGVRRWELASGRPTSSFFGLPGIVSSAEYSAASRLVLTSSATSTLVWDEDGDEPALELSDPMAFDAAFAPDGETFAVASSTGDVKVYDARSGEVLMTEDLQTEPLWAIDYAPDGRSLVVGGEGGTLWSVDAETGDEQWQRTYASDRIVDLAVSASGELVTIGLGAEGARWLALDDGTEQGSFESDADEVKAVAVRADGGEVAIGTTDGRVVLLDPSDGTVLRRFTAHQNAVYALDYSPDGLLLATGGFNQGGVFVNGTNLDAGLRLWSPSTGTRLAQLTFHDGQVESVSWADDGRWLVSGSADHTVALWPGPAQWPDLACDWADGELHPDQERDYLDPAQEDLAVCE